VASLASIDPTPPPSWGRMLSWEEVRSLHAAGHEIGSHSCSHALLPQLPALGDELAGSKRAIERELGAPVRSFCYPNGDHDRRVRDATEAAGYANAVTTRWGRNRPDADGYTLARCDMDLRRFRDRRGHISAVRTAMRLGGLQPGLA
jgi:peptidoglycan/xylan/chitin deacetylase (PgdA/CDA1 family)